MNNIMNNIMNIYINNILIIHLYIYFNNMLYFILYIYFFFIYTSTTEIYTLSLHDALPILSLDWSIDVEPSPDRTMYSIAWLSSSSSSESASSLAARPSTTTPGW